MNVDDTEARITIEGFPPNSRLCHNYKNVLNVILNEVKNLIFTTGYKTKILRLAPQNDIMTQSPDRRTGKNLGIEVLKNS